MNELLRHSIFSRDPLQFAFLPSTRVIVGTVSESVYTRCPESSHLVFGRVSECTHSYRRLHRT